MDGLMEIVIVASMFAVAVYRYRQATEGGEAEQRMEREIVEADTFWYLED